IAAANSPKMDTLRQSLVKTYRCPSDPTPPLPILPDSGPSGQTGLPRPVCMPATYRGVAGADWGGKDWGKDDAGGDENWDDGTQAPWLMQNHPEDRGIFHSCVAPSVATPERIASI